MKGSDEVMAGISSVHGRPELQRSCWRPDLLVLAGSASVARMRQALGAGVEKHFGKIQGL
jgi:hypothetical protein